MPQKGMRSASVKAKVGREIRKIGQRLSTLEKESVRKIIDRMMETSANVLHDSNENCPYDTGELRNSARIEMRTGHGAWTEVGGITGAGPGGGGYPFSSSGAEAFANDPRSYRVEMVIYYDRWNEKEVFDVAWFTHQDLNYTPRKGGGPKYLENAFDRFAPGFKRDLMRSLKEEMQIAGKRYR